MRYVENHENFVSERWIAEGSELARQAGHHGNFQETVKGPVMLRTLNLTDQQADLTVHGGVTKAVYAYPSNTTAIGEQSAGVICPGNVRRIYDRGIT